ncbi:MAG: peptidase S41 [Bacteroidetes bacterium 4484_276]|nr:MAG: peptidase S41 [Bacteroidetes bacterium 4484_276]OYT12340.1 MAG: peptidase S41 [Bacteroidetes bacterium 4572_114]
MTKHIKIYLIIISFLISGFLANAQESNNDFEISKNLDIFTELYKQLDMNYVDGIDPGDLMKTGIDAMLESLDPFTNYIPESRLEDYKLLTTGQYGGVGALIHKQDGYVVISEPYEGFPAQKAGLVAGDKILEVDGQPAKGKSTEEVSKVLKGEPGTNITILVGRLNSDEPVEIELQRENVKIDNIPYYGMLTEHIGYIKLSGFTHNAGQEVKKAFKELKDDNDLKGLVFDLRGNGGGLLNEAVNIVNIFVDKGELVVSTKGNDSSRNKSYYTTNKPEDLEIPLVFLVDPGSASASEIVVGAMQDLDRGVVLGQRTYGKGLVQNVLPLSYNSKVKVTVAKYYIPSGRCIQAIDYSHKDEDGYAHKIPDSLISEFETKNGRKVYDGGGIEPDIYLDPEKMSPLTVSLFSKFIMFDYANKFYLEHDSIPPPKEFKITDEIYDDFVNYVNGREDFDYTTASEKTLEKLKEATEKEDYFANINEEIEALEKKLMHNKDEDLMTQRDIISEILTVEIVTRYYYQKGKVKASLEFDPEVKKAIELIEGQEGYSSILNGGEVNLN